MGRYRIGIDQIFVKHLMFLTLLTFFILLPLVSLRLRCTMYDRIWRRDKKHAQEMMRKVNNDRLSKAQKYLSDFVKFNKTESLLNGRQNSGKSGADVGISVITVSRNRHVLDDYEPNYLTQVIATFLRLLNSSGKLHMTYKLLICNVDDEPKSYKEVNSLSKLVQTFNRFSSTSEKPAFRRSIDETLEKEKQDYVFCGNEAFKQNVSSVLLVEDDALPREDMLTILDHVLYSATNNNNNREISNVTYIKLYHPDRLLGYISLEAERLPELICLGLVLSTILVKAYLIIRPHLTKHIKLVWLSFFIYSCLFMLAVGRQNVNEFRRMSKHLYQLTPAPSCCTPAIVYTKSGFQTISTYLNSVKCKSGFGKDIAMDKLRKNSKMKALMVQPNLFTHIGMYSSLRDQVLDPFIV